MWQGWINLILGIWLIISGIFPALHHPINGVVVGILGMIFGFWAYRTWQGIVDGILGLWILLSGILFHLMTTANLIIVGIVVGVLGLWMGLTHPGEMKTKTA